MSASEARVRAKRRSLLGEDPGTASHKLKKRVMFKLAVEAGRAVCLRCKKPIESADEMSIDHIVAWLNSPDPITTFYDLNNVAFSHLSCNSSAAQRPATRDENYVSHGYHAYKARKCRCEVCREAAAAQRRRRKERKAAEHAQRVNELLAAAA
jgi:hypothetical protein